MRMAGRKDWKQMRSHDSFLVNSTTYVRKHTPFGRGVKLCIWNFANWRQLELPNRSCREKTRFGYEAAVSSERLRLAAHSVDALLHPLRGERRRPCLLRRRLV